MSYGFRVKENNCHVMPKGPIRMDGRGPFGIPAMPPRRKLFLTIAMSVLALLTIIRLIASSIAGSPDWPADLLGVAASIAMIVMVRRTPTRGA
jgi:hypothetical protein